MTRNQLISRFFKKINMKNIDSGIETFNKVIQDFGNSMDSLTREISADVEKSNREAEYRERKNKENLDKIWGKRK